MAILSDSPGLFLWGEGEELLFPVPGDVSRDLDAPDLLLRVPEPQLAEGNPQLGSPSVSVHMGDRFPDRIPGTVTMTVLAPGESLIAANARWIDLELETASIVVVAVQGNGEPVRIHEESITATQAGRNGASVMEEGADVEGVVIVEEIDLGVLCGRLPFPRIQLRKDVRWLRSGPGVLRKNPVQVDFPREPLSPNDGQGGIQTRWVLGTLRRPGLGHEERQSREDRTGQTVYLRTGKSPEIRHTLNRLQQRYCKASAAGRRANRRRHP